MPVGVRQHRRYLGMLLGHVGSTRFTVLSKLQAALWSLRSEVGREAAVAMESEIGLEQKDSKS